MALFDIIILLGDKYIMDYFTTKQGFFLYSSNIVEEELKKIFEIYRNKNGSKILDCTR